MPFTRRNNAFCGSARLGPSAGPVWFVETVVRFLPDDFRFSSATSDAMSVITASTWHYLVEDVAMHASQFNEAQIEALRNTPEKQRRVGYRSLAKIQLRHMKSSGASSMP